MVKLDAMHVVLQPRTTAVKGTEEVIKVEYIGLLEKQGKATEISVSAIGILTEQSEEEKPSYKAFAIPLEYFKKSYKTFEEHVKNVTTTDNISILAKYYKLRSRLLLPLFWRFTPFTYRMKNNGKLYIDKKIGYDLNLARIEITELTEGARAILVFEFPEAEKKGFPKPGIAVVMGLITQRDTIVLDLNELIDIAQPVIVPVG